VSPKRVVLRARAGRDISAALNHYEAETGTAAALGFIDALERVFWHIARHPATGTLRHAHELDLPGLRVWPLKRHPYLVFFVEQDDHIDVWRLLHDERDIPASMRCSADED